MFPNAMGGKILVVKLLFRGSEESQNSQWASKGVNMEINQKSTTILQLSRLREVLDNCSITTALSEQSTCNFALMS